MRIILAALALIILFPDQVRAQYWRPLPSGYCCWGAYREWPRGWYGWTPGYRYYGPGYYRPFSYWGRSQYYRY